MIEIVTGEDLKALYLETEHGTFTPNYTYDEYNPETDSYINLVINKTAQEVYDEWLSMKDKPTPPPGPTLEQRVDGLETNLIETSELHDETLLDIDYRLTCIELGI